MTVKKAVKKAGAALKKTKTVVKKTVVVKKAEGKKPKLAEIKTKPTGASIEDFISKLPDEQKRRDSRVILDLMGKITGEPPVLWGSAIIGFGNKRYKSPATGREVDWMRIGFSPRKTSLSIYLPSGIKSFGPLLKKLGKHKTGVGCLYINKLEDIDLKTLKEMIVTSLKRS